MGLNLLQHAKMHEDWRDMYIAQKIITVGPHSWRGCKKHQIRT